MSAEEDIRENPDVKVRAMSIDDIAPIFHLGEDLFTSQDYPNLYRTWDEYEVTSAFHINQETSCVAEVEGKVVGFLLGTIIEKERTAWNYGHLIWLGVSEEYQRYGIAGLLFDRFRKSMLELGVRMLLVDTQMSNARAIRFFEKKGFRNPTEHVYLTMNLESESNS
ncbi:MAG: GNAT family N-acetyltransferase [Candidatus Sumerlaeia bacterium]